LSVITALIALIYFAAFGFFLFKTAITSPISDMFRYVSDYLQFRDGKIELIDYLWKPHGEHHLVWIRLLTWADVEIFHTQAIPFIAAATAAISLTAAVIWYQLGRAEEMVGVAGSLALLAPMLILSTANVVDCSVPINTTYPITVFYVVLALVLFARAEESEQHANYWRVGATLAAFFAPLGMAAGLLVWPILFWTAWRGEVNRRWLMILGCVGLIYFVAYLKDVYFFGIVPSLDKGADSYLGLAHVGKLIDYFFSFLGLPFTRDPHLPLVGRVVGAFLFFAGLSAALIATFSKRLSTPVDRIGIGMILLGLGSAALASVGRGDLIEEVKVPVRYTIFVAVLQVGFLCLILPRFGHRLSGSAGRLLQQTVGIFLACLLLFLQIFVGRSAEQIASAISKEADCFAQGIRYPEVSHAISPTPEVAQEILVTLRESGLLASKAVRCTPPSR
jgi:hypothetical protein